MLLMLLMLLICRYILCVINWLWYINLEMYYRRWTRMFLPSALKYFHKYDVIDEGYQLHKWVFRNVVNPNPEQYKYKPKPKSEKDLDTKLINKLFSKYPDLKYQSTGPSKYKGQQLNTFSYAYSFLAEQKKLLKEGYSMDKSFQIVEGLFQDRIKRKMDQSLLARGLAIGNRARSFLNVHQQQVEHEAKLKTLRTKRELIKYEAKLKSVQEKLDSDESQEEEYRRTMTAITEDTKQQFKTLTKEEHYELMHEFETNFKNTFKQFYKRAAYKDRLTGLTDQEIRNQIRSSPNKIRNQTKELLEFLKFKAGATLGKDGKVEFPKNSPLDPKLKNYLANSKKVQIALLNYSLQYEAKPPKSYDYWVKLEKKRMLQDSTINQTETPNGLTIKDNKIKQYQTILGEQFSFYRNSFRIFETEEQRLFRLYNKYLLQQLGEKYNQIDQNQINQNINAIIENFRRIKFRVEKRYRKSTQNQILFQEHQNLYQNIDLQNEAEFQQLVKYLRLKGEQRRTSAIKIANDNKIKKLVEIKKINQIPIDESHRSD